MDLAYRITSFGCHRKRLRDKDYSASSFVLFYTTKLECFSNQH